LDRVKIAEAGSEPTPAPALREPSRPPEVTRFWSRCRADRGWGRPATGAAIALVALTMLGSIFVPQGSAVALSLLVAAAIAIDFGVQANLVFNTPKLDQIFWRADAEGGISV
jgi:hypothetical protein